MNGCYWENGNTGSVFLRWHCVGGGERLQTYAQDGEFNAVGAHVSMSMYQATAPRLPVLVLRGPGFILSFLDLDL